MKDLTLIIPAKNEEDSLPKVLDELKKFEYNICVILSANDTKTIESIKNYNCEILYQKNKGYGDALIYGIENIKTQFFCIFNADGSFDPAEIKNMLESCKKNNLGFLKEFNLPLIKETISKSKKENWKFIKNYKNSISNIKLNINLYYKFSNKIPSSFNWHYMKKNKEFIPTFTKKIFKQISILF